jgi:hypothetical protein
MPISASIMLIKTPIDFFWFGGHPLDTLAKTGQVSCYSGRPSSQGVIPLESRAEELQRGVSHHYAMHKRQNNEP